MRVDTNKEVTAVSTGNNNVKSDARRTLTGPLMMISNSKHDGYIVQMNSSTWYNVLRTKILDDLAEMYHQLEIQENEQKRIFIRSAIDNTLSCSVYQLMPKFRLFKKNGYVKTLRTTVRDMIGETALNYFKTKQKGELVYAD
jgi:hypothetical protein